MCDRSKLIDWEPLSYLRAYGGFDDRLTLSLIAETIKDLEAETCRRRARR